jgi:hypothetical protein
VKTLPGADIDSDCHLLVTKICTRLNQIIWFRKGKPRRVGKIVCLTSAPLIKFLGLLIDSNLTWNQQVDLILRRLSSSCYALNCVKYTLPIDILKLIYFANIQSIMSYGIIFWGASTPQLQL